MNPKQRLTAVGIRCADHVTPLYPQKLALTSPTGGGHSVGIVRSRTKATEFSLSLLPSEIGDLLGWTSTLGTGKSPQGPNLESMGSGARQSSLASPKIHG